MSISDECWFDFWQGKTLAFVLLVSESLTQGGQVKNLQRGRAPSVTRELAKQVLADFETYGNSVGLSTMCVRHTVLKRTL